MKKHKILIAGVLVLIVLAAAFFMGGPLEDTNVSEEPDHSETIRQEIPEQTPTQLPEQTTDVPAAPGVTDNPADDTETETPTEPVKSETETGSSDTETGGEKTENTDTQTPTDAPAVTEPVPSVPPDDSTSAGSEYTCTISISCATILNNMDLLDEGKAGLVPDDGWILLPVTVSFSDGDSVFDVLLKVAQEHKIHMEYMDSPMYNSAYIEGIANLYEYDCGSLSGWMYNVNGNFPNFGCSKYAVKDGDVIQWVYTCDLGADVGDNSMSGQMMPD